MLSASHHVLQCSGSHVSYTGQGCEKVRIGSFSGLLTIYLKIVQRFTAAVVLSRKGLAQRLFILNSCIFAYAEQIWPLWSLHCESVWKYHLKQGVCFGQDFFVIVCFFLQLFVVIVVALSVCVCSTLMIDVCVRAFLSFGPVRREPKHDSIQTQLHSLEKRISELEAHSKTT